MQPTGSKLIHSIMLDYDDYNYDCYAVDASDNSNYLLKWISLLQCTSYIEYFLGRCADGDRMSGKLNVFPLDLKLKLTKQK